jgi:hypothetical protein
VIKISLFKFANNFLRIANLNCFALIGSALFGLSFFVISGFGRYPRQGLNLKSKDNIDEC